MRMGPTTAYLSNLIFIFIFIARKLISFSVFTGLIIYNLDTEEKPYSIDFNCGKQTFNQMLI